jgi:nitroreductase
MARRYNPRTTPWHIDESEFYEIDNLREQREFLLQYAVLAPSGHNTQPWSFRITDRGDVEVWPDFTRRLPVADPQDRELLISVGAAIANLRVAAAHFGFDTVVTYGEQPAAVVSFCETCNPDESLRRLFGAITKRRTIRSEFEPRDIEPETLERICDAVESSELLRFIVPHERVRAAELVHEADHRLMSDERWRNELAEWVRPNETGACDGLTGDAFGIPGPLSALAPWLVRSFDLSDPIGRHDRELVERAAGLIVVTSHDDRIALVCAGEALERLLLLLTSYGVQYAFVNQPVEVPELRRELWKLVRTPMPPQLMLRIGYARVAPRPMPRRPVSAVL